MDKLKIWGVIWLCFSSLSLAAQYYPVNEGYHWGLIDSTGKVVIPIQYLSIEEDFKSLPKTQKLFRVMGKQGVGVYHLDLGEVVPLEMDSIRLKEDTDGNSVLIGYKEISDIYRGTSQQLRDSVGRPLSEFRKPSHSSNSALKVVIPAQFFSGKNFQEGRAAVRMSDGYHYIDTTGSLVIEGPFIEANDFVLGTTMVSKARKKMALDLDGKPLKIPNAKYLTMDGFYPTGFAQTRKYDRKVKGAVSGMIDLRGNWVLEPTVEPWSYDWLNSPNAVSIRTKPKPPKLGWKPNETWRQAVYLHDFDEILIRGLSYKADIWEVDPLYADPVRHWSTAVKIRGYEFRFAQLLDDHVLRYRAKRLQMKDFRYLITVNWLSPFQIVVRSPYDPTRNPEKLDRERRFNLVPHQEEDFYHFFHYWNRRQLTPYTRARELLPGKWLSQHGAPYGLLNEQGKKVTNAIFDEIYYVRGLYQVWRNGRVGYIDKEEGWIYPPGGW